MFELIVAAFSPRSDDNELSPSSGDSDSVVSCVLYTSLPPDSGEGMLCGIGGLLASYMTGY